MRRMNMSTENTTENPDRKEPGKTPGIRKGPRVLGTLILIILILAGISFGAVRGLEALKYVGTDDAAVDCKQVNISSRILGRIESIRAEEGQQVREGDILITLEAADLHAQETQAQAQVAYARQNLVLAGISQDKARDDADRIQNLYNNGAATRESWEHAKSALNAARAQVSLAQAQVDTSLAQLGVIESQLLNTRIRTPMDGTVYRVALSAGDVVQPGQTILSVNNLEDIWITANMEETKISRVRPGARAVITVDALGRRTFSGTVEMIRSGIVAPAFQIGEFTKTTRRIPLKIRFDTPVAAESGAEGTPLVPGMSAEIKIRTPRPLPEFLDR